MHFYQVWLELFERPASLACHFTNIKGRARFGASWSDIDKKTLLQFHCCLYRMALVVRPSVSSYFSKTDGDVIIRQIGLSRFRFCSIYSSFSLCDEEVAAKKGLSDRAKPHVYDGLHKIRDVWNLTMLQFQNARNPGRVLSLDESMQLFTGAFPWRQVIPRKPDPTGAKNDCLCEPSGYLHNAIPATTDPLPFDHHRGRVFAVMLSLLTSSTLGSDGKNFLRENRCVSIVLFCLTISAA